MAFKGSGKNFFTMLGLIAWGLCASFMVSGPTSAETYLEFERFSDPIGGRQNSVYEVYRDEHDFMWFASDTDGLLRYDGYESALWSSEILAAEDGISFSYVRRTSDGKLWAATWGDGLLSWDQATGQQSQFTHNPEDPNSLMNDRVQTLFEDSLGRLWVGTLSGLNYFSGEYETQSNASPLRSFPESHPLRTSRIWGVAESDNKIWVASNQGLFELSKDLTEWQQHLIIPGAANEYRFNEIRTVNVFQEQIWVGSDEGVFLFNPNNKVFTHIPVPAEANYIAQVRVNELQPITLGQTDQAVILVGTLDGLFALDPETQSYRTVHEGQWHLMPDIDVRSIEQDSIGGVWIGTRDLGIYYTSNEASSFNSIAEANPDIAAELELDRAVFAAFAGENEELWLGTSNGVVVRSASAEKWQRLEGAQGDALGRVESVLRDNEGTYWVAANRNLYRQTREDTELVHFREIHRQLGIEATSITSIAETQNGKLLFGLWGLGVAEYDLNTDTFQWVFRGFEERQGDLVYDMVTVPEHGEWLVSRYAGLHYRVEGSSDWQHYDIPESAPLANDSFFCAYAWRPNELWLCTERGLWKLNTSSMKIDQVEGPLNNVRVIGLIHDLDNRLWMLSSLGLTRYNPNANTMVTFGLNDGLPATEFLRQSISRAPEGDIVVGSVRGAFEFNPHELNFNRSAPQIGLSRVWVNDEDVTGVVGLEEPAINLSFKDRVLTVQFTVLDFHDTSRNSVRYRLLGLNNQWSQWSNQRTVTFGSLAPGEYHLEVQGRNSLGIPARESLSIPINVAEPWWQSIWVWLIVAILVFYTFQSVLKWRLRSLERANERLDNIVQERTQELETLNNELKAQSQTDYLTKLPNRRGFTERFKLLQAQAKRNMKPMALIICDVDHFKSFNDNYGHEAGDQVLMALGTELKNRLREQDIAARWGGEEFSVLLADTDIHGAQVVCENLRKAIEEMSVVYDGHKFEVTASFGLFASEDTSAPLDHWMHCADIALYKSKDSGRNRVEVYTANMEKD